ncbi:hypothetical protein [Bordetella sp. 2513F-2]
MEARKKVKLFLHVGAGKTGTTSIQEMLKSGQEVLKKNGVWYLGMMLENANHYYSWQRPTTVNQDFHALDHQMAVDQVVSVMRSVIAEARSRKIDTLIWSNESFFDRSTQVLEALSQLKDSLEVVVVVYVRRHDGWAQSAYMQWGLKHKTYAGPVRSFREWVATGIPKFADRLKTFTRLDEAKLVVRNLDVVKDSVEDFKKICGIEKLDLSAQRLNERMEGVEIFLRALLNNNYRPPVLPAVFDRVLGRGALQDGNPDGFLKGLMPTEDDLDYVRTACADDRDALNKILKEHGQPPLSENPLPVNTSKVDQEKLLYILSRLIISQAIRLEKLEHAVDAMAKQNVEAPHQPLKKNA